MTRKPLGRGLGALIESSNDTTTSRTHAMRENAGITMAPVESIKPGAFQPRQHFDADRLAELTRAIQSQGIIEPLIVRAVETDDGDFATRYELIAGERRLRA